MPGDDLANLVTNLVLLQSCVRDPKAHWHKFHSNDSNVVVAIQPIVWIQLGQELYIRVESNTDAVYEKNGELGLGCVWTVPI
jgi:hypothetical protein